MAVKTEKGSEVKDFTNDPIDNDRLLGFNQSEGTRWWNLSQFWNWVKTKTASVITAGDKSPVNSDAINNILSNYINNEKYLVTDKTEYPFNNIDLNTLTQNGVYFVTTNDSTRDNYPSGTNGVLYVYSHTVGNNILTRQIFYRVGTINTNDYNIFTRQISSSGNVGNWIQLITSHEMMYNMGETVQIQYNTHAVLNGIISSSSTKVIVNIELPKELPTTKAINITNIYGSLRGIAGYLDSKNSERELTSEYTVTIQKTAGKNAAIVFTKSSAFTNTTNNTITSAYLDRLAFTIPNS